MLISSLSSAKIISLFGATCKWMVRWKKGAVETCKFFSFTRRTWRSLFSSCQNLSTDESGAGLVGWPVVAVKKINHNTKFKRLVENYMMPVIARRPETYVLNIGCRDFPAFSGIRLPGRPFLTCQNFLVKKQHRTSCLLQFTCTLKSTSTIFLHVYYWLTEICNLAS
jgi:hypothetical protein